MIMVWTFQYKSMSSRVLPGMGLKTIHGMWQAILNGRQSKQQSTAIYLFASPRANWIKANGPHLADMAWCSGIMALITDPNIKWATGVTLHDWWRIVLLEPRHWLTLRKQDYYNVDSEEEVCDVGAAGIGRWNKHTGALFCDADNNHVYWSSIRSKGGTPVSTSIKRATLLKYSADMKAHPELNIVSIWRHAKHYSRKLKHYATPLSKQSLQDR